MSDTSCRPALTHICPVLAALALSLGTGLGKAGGRRTPQGDSSSVASGRGGGRGEERVGVSEVSVEAAEELSVA